MSSAFIHTRVRSVVGSTCGWETAERPEGGAAGETGLTPQPAAPAVRSHHVAHLFTAFIGFVMILLVHLFTGLWAPFPGNVRSVRASALSVLHTDLAECLAQNSDSRNTC